jgi:hypothetical protein
MHFTLNNKRCSVRLYIKKFNELFNSVRKLSYAPINGFLPRDVYDMMNSNNEKLKWYADNSTNEIDVQFCEILLIYIEMVKKIDYITIILFNTRNSHKYSCGKNWKNFSCCEIALNIKNTTMIMKNMFVEFTMATNRGNTSKIQNPVIKKLACYAFTYMKTMLFLGVISGVFIPLDKSNPDTYYKITTQTDAEIMNREDIKNMMEKLKQKREETNLLRFI